MTTTPTKAEKEWMRVITQEIGCIACRRAGHGYTPAEVHHLKSGGRRVSHMASIPLCHRHHRGGAGTGDFVSRHPFKVRLEGHYGTESELLDHARRLVAKQAELTV